MFNQEKYEKAKIDVQNDIDNHSKSAYEYMDRYKACIKREDYETAKAITEVLAPLGYHTIDTHSSIKSLHDSKR